MPDDKSFFEQLLLHTAVELTALAGDSDMVIWSTELNTKPNYAFFTGYILAGDGRKFCLQADKYENISQGRVSVTGTWPRCELDQGYYAIDSYHDNTPKITVAARRGAAALAKEIQARFLPRFNSLWALALERNSRHDAGILQQRAMKQAVADAFPSARLSDHYREEVYLGHSSIRYSGTARINKDSIDLDLHWLTLAQVQQIAAILEPQEAKHVQTT